MMVMMRVMIMTIKLMLLGVFAAGNPQHEEVLWTICLSSSKTTLGKSSALDETSDLPAWKYILKFVQIQLTI